MISRALTEVLGRDIRANDPRMSAALFAILTYWTVELQIANRVFRIAIQLARVVGAMNRAFLNRQRFSIWIARFRPSKPDLARSSLDLPNSDWDSSDVNPLPGNLDTL